jgi:AcrR family transcriptional regulator
MDQLRPAKKPIRGAKGYPRRPELSRARILDAAVSEFAEQGFAGARVDAIAARAEINKRMIYHYFHSKDGLFQAALEKVYTDIWAAESELHLEDMPPRDALAALVTFVWNYYRAHPEFITLLNTENRLKAVHFKNSKVIRDGASGSKSLVDDVLARGVATGEFRPGIDPVHLSLTITSLCYYYLTNHATSAVVYGRKLTTRAALDERLAFNIEAVLSIVSA